MKRNILFSKLSLTLLALIFCATKTNDLAAMKINLNCSCCNAINQVEEEQDQIRPKIYSHLKKELINTEKIELYLVKLIERCAQRSSSLTDELQPIVDALVKNNHWAGVLHLIVKTNSLILYPSRACLNKIIQNFANTNDNKLAVILTVLAINKKNKTISSEDYTDILTTALIKAIKTSKSNALHNSKRAIDLVYKLFSKEITTTPLANLYDSIKESIEKTAQSKEEATKTFHKIVSTTFSLILKNNMNIVGEFFKFVFVQTKQKDNSLLAAVLAFVSKKNTKEETNYLLKKVAAKNRGETIS